MKIKRLKTYRKNVKQNTKGLNYDEWDEDFMGYESSNLSGFFKLLHGNKPDIEGLLAMPTEMAEDGQAVYEFIQNAADCCSSHFYMFYNNEYLLTINNGTVFDEGGILSILNLGQSYNKKHDPDKIGRFGIGFKLVHRLVGATSGLKEIINDYQGPQLFSWSRQDDFDAFVNDTDFIEDDFEKEYPWLLKILITCFPATVNENVKDLDYNQRTAYTYKELLEFQDAFRENLNSIDRNVMNQGTMIFIKLGEGKSEILNKNQDDINNRLENTLYFLKDLKHLQVNDKVIKRQNEFVLENKFEIEPDENDFISIGLTDKRDSQFPIVLQFGYNCYSEGISLLGDYPNFYKYFPMEDTTYGLNFIFHSNVFSIGSNRRHIHEDYINKGLLDLFAKRITQRMEEYKLNKSNNYYDIFANVLLSDCDKSFVNDHLFMQLLRYVACNVPTKDDRFENKDNVIIKNTKIQCEPSDFGVSKYWYRWDALNNNNQELIRQSKVSSKLCLKAYRLKNLLEEGKILNINQWIKQLDTNTFSDFLNELNEDIPSNMYDIQFIKLENEDYISINEINSKSIIKFPKISSIESILKSLGFELCSTDFESFNNLKTKISEKAIYLKTDAEAKLYENYLISILPENKLSSHEKKVLFLTLSSFKNIGEKTLSDKLMLFCNLEGKIYPLSKMVDPGIKNIESWLKDFTIKEDEVFDEIKTKDYLRGETTLFNDIIAPNWTIITNKIITTEVLDFMQSIVKYHKLSENPVSIKSKPFIYSSQKGWIEYNQSVFYHTQLSACTNYSGLVEVIHKNNLICPDKNQLNFYLDEPFQINDSQIDLLLNSNYYTNEAALALLEFCKGKINIFDYGYFTEESNIYFFHKDQSIKQYYSIKVDVVEFTNKYSDKILKPLPLSLSGYKENAIKGQELYKYILDTTRKNWEVDNDVLKQLILLLYNSDLTDIVKQFVNDQKSIELSQHHTEQKDITYMWIQLINSVYELAEIEQIKGKVSIDGIKLSELLWNNRLYLENGSEIELGYILSKFKDNKVVANIKESLLDFKCFDSNKINKLFQSDTEPANPELLEIANEMLEIEQNQLKNLDQLKLILYLYSKDLIHSLKPIFVLAIDDKWYSLEDSWYLNRHKYINDNSVLDTRYNGIGRLAGKSFNIISKPYFQRDKNQFICPHLKDNLKGNDLIDFFELVKEQVTKNAQSKVNWLDDLSDSIGFLPSKKVLESDPYIHESEKLPIEIEQWGKRQLENEKLLEIIGVHGSNSSIVKLRKFLFGLMKDYSFEGFSRNNECDQKLLLNTISLLATKNITLYESQSSTTKQLTDYLGAQYDISEIYLPVGIGLQDGKLLSQFKETNNCYSLSSELVRKYNGYKIGSFVDICLELIEEGVFIVDSDFLCDLWVKKYTHPLLLNEPTLDIVKLNEHSITCDLPQYHYWKKISKSEIDIYFIDIQIPAFLSFNNLEEILKKTIFTTDYEYLEINEKKVLYTKRETYIEAILSYLKEIISPEDLIILIGNSNVSVINNQLEDLKRENEYLKEQLNKVQPNIELYRGDLDKDNQRDWNLEARKLLREKLETIDGFDCSGWDDSNVPSSLVKGIKFNGKPIIWVVRSAMSYESIFHLTPYEWTILSEKNVLLALRTSKDTIQVYGINEDICQTIYNENHTINFNFDSALLTFDVMNALTNTLVAYNVWGSGLVFKNPHYSAGTNLQDLNKCKDGILNKLSDEAL